MTLPGRGQPPLSESELQAIRARHRGCPTVWRDGAYCTGCVLLAEVERLQSETRDDYARRAAAAESRLSALRALAPRLREAVGKYGARRYDQGMMLNMPLPLPGTRERADAAATGSFNAVCKVLDEIEGLSRLLEDAP